MNLDAALDILAEHRGDRIVIPTMSSVGLWPKKSDTPRDFVYMPSSMGQGVPLALGIVLARPGTGAIVISGDGSLLMNLGCLATLAMHPVAVTVILIDNGLYEVTGGQPIVGAGKVDFCGVARACGIANVTSFETVEAWRTGAESALAPNSPNFIRLKVAGELGKATPAPPRPAAEAIARLQGALGVR